MSAEHDTEIALLRQMHEQLASKIDDVDANCDKRSDQTDAKLDRLQWFLITTMASVLIAMFMFIATTK